MATVETTMGLGPQKSMFVLVVIVGCFAVLWPRILSPMFLGPPKDILDPNSFDKSAGVRQERPSHLKHPPIHPALRERGRAIPPSPHSVPHPTVPIVPHTGRPIPMRPPMGSPGRVAPPPKSSVGFLMPLYTLCIVIFFFYTMFKLVFRKNPQEPVTQPLKYVPDKQGSNFRKTVFNKPDRNTQEASKLVVSAISGLVAEVKQQMEEECNNKTDITPNNQEPPAQPYTNGSVRHEQRESSPILTKASKDYNLLKETTPPSWEASTPVHREETILAEEFIPKEREPSPVKETTPEPVKESTPPPYKEDVSAAAAVVDEPIEEKKVTEVEKIGTKHEEDIVEKLRSSVEKENATVKVLGMEMRAHCEGGKKWTSPRPPTPPVALAAPPPHAAVAHHVPGRTTPDVEVSSIYLEGALPHQSRLLVADSETHTEKLTNGDDRDTPIVLSGKMTLSLINDTSTKSTPDRDYAVRDESTVDDDEDFVTASAATVPKQEEEEENEKGSEEEEEELEQDEEIIADSNVTKKNANDDKGETIVTDETKAVLDHEVENNEGQEEYEEEDIEYEEDDEMDEVIEVVEEPKKGTITTQVVEAEKSDKDEDLEEEYEEVEEEEEIEVEPVEDKTESTSVEARKDNTISTSSDANTSKKVEDEIEYEEDDEEEEVDDEIYVEESKNAAGDLADRVDKVIESSTGTASSDNSLSSKDVDELLDEGGEEEEVEYEEEEIEVEDDEEEIEEIDEVIESGNKHSAKDT